MVEKRICAFCEKEIEPGTGRMYVKKDGTVLFFCSNKCYKNAMELKRVPRRVRWTGEYKREKKIRVGTKEEIKPENAKKKRVKKTVKKSDKKE